MNFFKKSIISIFAVAALFCAATAEAFAVDSSMSFNYALRVDGKTAITVQPGDITNVELTLSRTDSEDVFPMYALQGNVCYNKEFFELVPESISKGTGVSVNETEMSGTWSGWASISVSAFSAATSGVEWQNSTMMVSFKLRTLQVGTSTIFSRDFVVSTADGMDSYSTTINDATVSVKKPETSRFIDVPDSEWYAAAVKYVVDAGLFNGTSANEFSPNANMTRAMLTTVLWRLAGYPEPQNPDSGFNDVEDGMWYTDAVKWANENSIVTGYGDGRFGTEDSITREQLATILYRFAKHEGNDLSSKKPVSDFTDATSVSVWATEAIEWAIGSDIITGTGDNKLSPIETATRAQVATTLMRFTNLASV